jgi:hypothetical protein
MYSQMALYYASIPQFISQVILPHLDDVMTAVGKVPVAVTALAPILEPVRSSLILVELRFWFMLSAPRTPIHSLNIARSLRLL